MGPARSRGSGRKVTRNNWADAGRRFVRLKINAAARCRDDDAVEKHQNRSDDADGDDNADDQRERDTDNCKRIPVRHRATMQAFAQGRQGSPRAPSSPIKLSNSQRQACPVRAKARLIARIL
jgi:hypothetical protein